MKKTVISGASALIFLLGSVQSVKGQFDQNRIKMSSTINPYKLTLFGSPTPADPYAFYGFGIEDYMMSYSVDSENSRHVFQAKISQNARRLLLELKGNGNVSVPGPLTLGNELKASGIISANKGLEVAQGYNISFKPPVSTPALVPASIGNVGNYLTYRSMQTPANAGVEAGHQFVSQGAGTSNILLQIKNDGRILMPETGILDFGLGHKGLIHYYAKTAANKDFLLIKGAADDNDENNARAVIYANDYTDITGAVGIGFGFQQFKKPTAPLSDGTDISGYKVFVNGGLLAKEVRVRSSWADYVFSPQYRLNSLEEVESFISKNHRLPGIPAAEQIEKDGLALGDMVRLQQEKIEELTLYIIKMNKEIESLKAKVK